MVLAYVLLSISSVIGSLMAVCRKYYQGKKGISLQANLLFAVIYSSVIALVTFVIFLVEGKYFAVDLYTIFLAFSMGVIMVVSTILGIVAAKYGSLAIFVMFSVLGSICVSSVFGVLYNNEGAQLSVYDYISYVLILGIVLISYLTADKKVTHKKKYFFICMLSFASNGLGLPISSLITNYRPDLTTFNFLMLSSSISVLLLLIPTVLSILYFRKKTKGEALVMGETEQEPKSNALKCYLFVVLYGIGSLLTNAISIECVKLIPIAIQSSLSFALTIIITSLFEYIFYKTKLTKYSLLQLILAVVCSILFSL